jgi:hypothetical protein
MADVSGVGVCGPLGPFVAGFAAELSRQGYKPQPVGKQIGLLAALSGWLAADGWDKRILSDGSRHQVYKRYFSADQLATELGGAPLFDGHWFVAATVSWARETTR